MDINTAASAAGVELQDEGEIACIVMEENVQISVNCDIYACLGGHSNSSGRGKGKGVVSR